jgi:hypothetical protein
MIVDFYHVDIKNAARQIPGGTRNCHFHPAQPPQGLLF